MYMLAYADATSDASHEARVRERDAIGKSIELMEHAEAAGVQSRESIVALNFLRSLWTILIEDLASPENGLAPILRAQLISIGLSIMRQAEEIRLQKQTSFSGLIDISRLIMAGLK